MNKAMRTLRRPNYSRIARATLVHANTENGNKYVPALTRQCVSGILRGKVSYSKDSLGRIAKVLDVTPGWLANYIAEVG